MSDIDLAAIRERYERAYQHVADLCDPKNPSARWTMRVPAEPDRDSDLVIGAALDDIPRLLDALDAAEADAARLAAALIDVSYDEKERQLCWCAGDAGAEHLTICVAAMATLSQHRERTGGERTS